MIKKYFTTFSTTLSETYTYRAQTLVWVLNSIAWVAVFPFVWLTVYGQRESIAGFERAALFTYFFLVPTIDIFINSWVYESMQHMIKDGSVVNYVQKPINYIGYMFSRARGWQTSQTVITILISGVLYLFLHPYLAFPAPNWQLLWFIPVAAVGIMVAFLFGTIIGLISFFTTEGGWLKHFWWMLTTIASGYLIPIQFFPSGLQHILSFTPFPLILQTPIFTLLNRMSVSEIVFQLFVGLIWIIGLSVAVYALWHNGSKRFDSIGI